MTRARIAALTNFFLPGLGYIINGQRTLLGVGFLLGAFGLTYVELGIQTAAPTFYWPMFAAVFLMNTCFAVDALNEGRQLAA